MGNASPCIPEERMQVLHVKAIEKRTENDKSVRKKLCGAQFFLRNLCCTNNENADRYDVIVNNIRNLE